MNSSFSVTSAAIERAVATAPGLSMALATNLAIAGALTVAHAFFPIVPVAAAGLFGALALVNAVGYAAFIVGRSLIDHHYGMALGTRLEWAQALAEREAQEEADVIAAAEAAGLRKGQGTPPASAPLSMSALVAGRGEG